MSAEPDYLAPDDADAYPDAADVAYLDAARTEEPLDDRIEMTDEEIARTMDEAAGLGPVWSSVPWSTFRDESPPDVEFLIEGLWPRAAFGFIAGPPKQGKTWLGLTSGVCIASGRPLFGEFVIPRPETVLYVALEGVRAGIRARTGALARGHGIDPEGFELDRLHFLYKPRPFNLADPDLASMLIADARRIGAAFVLVDVFREAQRGLKEASAEDFAIVRDALQPLTDADCSVALLHHFGKLTEGQRERSPGERMAGSGAMFGALDAGIYITGSEAGARQLKLELSGRDFATPEVLGVAIVGTGSLQHGGFAFEDVAEVVLDAAAAADRDLVGDIEKLLEDGEWLTLNEIAGKDGIAAHKDDVAAALEGSPQRFVRLEKGAKLAGRKSSNAKPYGTRGMFAELLPQLRAAYPQDYPSTLDHALGPDGPESLFGDTQTESGPSGLTEGESPVVQTDHDSSGLDRRSVQTHAGEPRLVACPLCEDERPDDGELCCPKCRTDDPEEVPE